MGKKFASQGLIKTSREAGRCAPYCAPSTCRATSSGGRLCRQRRAGTRASDLLLTRPAADSPRRPGTDIQVTVGADGAAEYVPAAASGRADSGRFKGCGRAGRVVHPCSGSGAKNVARVACSEAAGRGQKLSPVVGGVSDVDAVAVAGEVGGGAAPRAGSVGWRSSQSAISLLNISVGTSACPSQRRYVGGRWRHHRLCRPRGRLMPSATTAMEACP